MNADLATFLERFRPDGYTTFVGIVPDGTTVAETFNGVDPSKAAAWIERQNSARNVYFTVNPTPVDLRRKPTKANITEVACMWADIDPRDDKGRAWSDERQRLLALADELAALPLPPSLIIDSGNGIQPIWLLAEPIGASPEDRDAAEALCARIEAALGAKGTHNIDRLLRVPGTRNFPNAKKKKLGRGETDARLFHAGWRRYSWRELEDLADRLEQQPLEHAEQLEPRDSVRDSTAADLDLPSKAPEPLEPGRLKELRTRHPDPFDLARYDGDQSRQDLALASLARRLGWPHVEAWQLIIAVRGDRKSRRRDYIERTLGCANAAGQPAPNGQAAGDTLLDLSHDGLALDMGRGWQTGARHVARWGKWLFWTGKRWEPDEGLQHMTKCRAYLRARADSLVRAAHEGRIDLDVEQAEKIAKGLRAAPMVANVVGLARSNEELVATVAQWDRDPYLLGTPAGTVDLRTGKLRDPRPDEYITKVTAVAPASPGTPAPIWNAFLERIFCHDPELVPFIQRALGYSLLGTVSAHVLLFCWGQGSNGKGVLLNTASRILGDYAAVAPSDLLLVSNADRHPCDMAMLRGARMVTAQELAPGRAWDEPKLKSLTGGDPITARFMRQDFFTYEPQFTLWVAGNHKPSFRSVDEAIKRRVLLVPFLQVIPEAERDQDLPKKLEAEWPSILRWMIDGCLAWQRKGLAPPRSAKAATKDYLDADDTLGQWLEERCVINHKVEWTGLKSLYADWSEWCNARGQRPGTARALSKALDERGLERQRRAPGEGFCGVGLVDVGNVGKAANTRNARAQGGAQGDYADYRGNLHFLHTPKPGHLDGDDGDPDQGVDL